MPKSILKNLHNILDKPHIRIGIIVFLIALLSFGLGCIVGRDSNPAPIIIEKNSIE
jgi:hypothetical protein